MKRKLPLWNESQRAGDLAGRLCVGLRDAHKERNTRRFDGESNDSDENASPGILSDTPHIVGLPSCILVRNKVFWHTITPHKRGEKRHSFIPG